jgi:hypothetical protein
MTFDDLKERVARPEIDTVLECTVDMQGRLMGKRHFGEEQGRHFGFGRVPENI